MVYQNDLIQAVSNYWECKAEPNIDRTPTDTLKKKNLDGLERCPRSETKKVGA